MVRSGTVLDNPITGERLIFRRCAAETGGELVVVECIVQPGGAVAAAHVHPRQEERFEVLRGTLGVRIGRTKQTAAPGERLTIPAGTAHAFWNAGDEEAHFVCEVRPAGGFEQLVETMFGLACDGRTNRRGMPSPLRLAVIARHHFDDLRLPFVPAWLQRAALACGAPLGRLCGFRPTYESAGRVGAGAEA